MNKFIVDNSADLDLKRVILWQYDQAEKFVGWVGILRDFFLASTEQFWDSLPGRVNISIADSVEDFGLSIWGLVIGVGRPSVTVDGIVKTISSELYRRILIARFRLSSSNASIEAYDDFVDFIFQSNVSVSDNGNMSMTFEWIGSGSPTSDSEKEMKALVEQRPEAVVAYPSGVRDDARSDSLIFGLSVTPVPTEEDPDPRGEPQDELCGGFDESSYCWRYTTEGNWR